jgi:hypothetical protein
MAKYKRFEENSDVMDVLACVIAGRASSKSMVAKLKQPQPTVATKLKFLIDNGLVKKDKWTFSADMAALNAALSKALGSWISAWAGKSSGFAGIFTDGRLERIWTAWAEHVLAGISQPESVSEIALGYLLGLSQTDEKTLGRLGPKFIKLRKLITAESVEKALFTEAEGVEKMG